MNTYIQAYKSAFENVDKLNQAIMLFDTAIASMQQAKQSIVDKKIEDRFNKLTKVFNILTGLRDALDHNSNPELAKTLEEWYSATALRVLSINRTQDLSMCDLCEKHLKEMRSAWLDVEKKAKEENTVAKEAAQQQQQQAQEADNSNIILQENSNSEFFEQSAKNPYANINLSALAISV
jgi:flagellar protein FliS